MRRRSARARCLQIIVSFVAIVVGVALWGIFWPAPSHAPQMTCPAHPYHPCVHVAGRVLWHTSFGPGRRGHAVLLSRQSLTLPGIVVLEFPHLDQAPQGLGVGDWIVAIGVQDIGSHHETDLHVTAFATAKVRIACGYNTYAPCRRLPLHSSGTDTSL